MRRRYRLLLMAEFLGVLAVLLFAGQRAAAFQVSVHDEILEAALKDVANDAARAKTEGHLLAGTGAGGVDLDQVNAEKHFDSVRNPAELCQMWEKGFKPTLITAVQYALGSAYWQSAGQYGLFGYNAASLDYFGRAAHAIQDFYSHSNWVELRQNATADLPLTTAPIVGAQCDPAAFPPELQTGYASLAAFLTFGTWCNPYVGPPIGYRHCHDDLAKDKPDEEHGKTYPTGDTPTRPGEQTYHEMAKGLSIQATRELWQLFHDNVVFQIERDRRFNGYDAECLFRGIANYDEETSTCAKCPAPGSTGSVIPNRILASEPQFSAAPSVDLRDSLTVSAAQPASCPATATGGTYSATSGLSGEILDTVASSVESRWGFRGEPVTLSRGELRLVIDADGRLTNGTIVLEGSKAGGETARFEGTADPGFAGSAFFRGPLRACGGPLGCLEVDGRLSLTFIVQPAGEWYVCLEINDRCRANPLGILRNANGAGTGVAGQPPLEPELGPSWDGTFSTNRGTLQLVVTGFSATGTFRRTAATASASASRLVDRQTAAIESSADPVEGTIIAAVVGDRLRGVWFDGASFATSMSAGDIDFVLSEDGGGFDGRWSSVEDGDWHSDWSGVRMTSSSTGGTTPPVQRPVITLRGGTGPALLGCIPCDGQARFMGPGQMGYATGLGVGNAGEASVAVAEPAGTLRNLRVRISAADGGIWTFNVWVNGGPSAIVCAINGRDNRDQTTCDSGTTSVAIRAGDRVSVGVGNPGDPFTRGNFTVEWSLELETAP